MLDHATLIRQAFITALKGDPDVGAQVGARVYDQVVAEPTWDFIRIAPPDKQLYESSCGDGWEMEWRIHIFGRGPDTKRVNELESKVFNVIIETDLSIPAFSRLDIDFVRSSTSPDGASPRDYHTTMVVRTVSVE